MVNSFTWETVFRRFGKHDMESSAGGDDGISCPVHRWETLFGRYLLYDSSVPSSSESSE